MEKSRGESVRFLNRFLDPIHLQIFGLCRERRDLSSDWRQSEPAGGTKSQCNSGVGIYDAQYGTCEKSGFVSIVDAYKLGLKFDGSGIAATGAFVREHRAVVESLFKGFLEGVAYAKQNREESIRLIGEFMLLKDQDEAENCYKVIIEEVHPRKPYPLKEGIETVLRDIGSTLPKGKTVKREDLIDDSFVKKTRPERFY